MYARAHSHTDTKSQTHSYRHACTHNNDDHHPRHRHGQITCMTVLTIFGVSFGVLMISSVSDFADFFSIFLAFSLSSFLKEWMEFRETVRETDRDREMQRDSQRKRESV